MSTAGTTSIDLQRAEGGTARVAHAAPAGGRRGAMARPALPVAAGAVTVAVGVVVLLGWDLGATLLTTFGLADSTKANTAVGLVLLGGAVWVLPRAGSGQSVGTALALFAAAIGLATAFEYATGLNLGIDELFVQDPTGDGIPGRMSPFSAFGFAVIGLAAPLAARGMARPLVLTAVTAVAATSLLTVFNFLFGGEAPAFLDDVTQMHPVVGAVFVLLGLAVLDLLGATSPLELLRGRAESATLARRVALASAIVLVSVTALRVMGEGIGLYHSRFGASLTLVASLVGIGLVVVSAASGGRRLEREREVAQTERDRFFDLSLDMLATLGPDGQFVRMNRAWETTLGRPIGELVGRPWAEFVHPDDIAASEYEFRRQFSEGKTVLYFQNRFRDRDGSYRWLEWSSQPGADASHVYAVARDITVRKAEEERLTRRAASLALKNEKLADRAVRDSLTGLHNRAYLDATIERLEAARRKSDAEPLSAILFDLDHFGAFNKQYGHQAGDAVLRAFAGLLRRRFRGGDLVARYGGEEFVALLPGATRDAAERAAEDVRLALEGEAIGFDGGELRATVSGGCAELRNGMTIAELIAVADMALVQAKRAGRNMVVAA